MARGTKSGSGGYASINAGREPGKKYWDAMARAEKAATKKAGNWAPF